MPEHERINYVEFASADLAVTKQFFQTAFDWQFEDYGPEYTAFTGAGLDGGFYQAKLRSRADEGAALIVFYSDTLEDTLEKVRQAGGTIIQNIFSFPGGRRFHFTEPSGNEFAVWTHTNESD